MSEAPKILTVVMADSGPTNIAIVHEYARAFAGLADEELRPCVDPCAGHLGPKANELFRRGLARYKEMYGERS